MKSAFLDLWIEFVEGVWSGVKTGIKVSVAACLIMFICINFLSWQVILVKKQKETKEKSDEVIEVVR